MSKRSRIDRLARAQTAALGRIAGVPPIELPDIVTFVTSPQYLNRPNLYPKQALLLKVMSLDLDALTSYDHEVIAGWGGGFTAVGEPGDRRYEGAEGMPPDVLVRMEACLAEGRRWFREIVLVIGRRGSKGYLTALAAAYVVWHYLAHGNPQGHYGLEQTKRLTGMVFAGEHSQASDNLFRDLSRLVSSAPCFEPYVAATTKRALHLCTPRDLREGQRPARELASSASLVIDARPTTGLAGRGPAAFMTLFDELAHLGVDTARSADELYEAAVPALDQFGVDGLIVQASSPASQLGKFYASYRAALALNDDDTPKDPTMLTVQLPSWALYEDWELTNLPGGLSMLPDGPNFARIDKPALVYGDAMRRAEVANRSVFAVERRAQWRTSMNSFLDADVVDAVFAPHNGTVLAMQQHGRLGTEYVVHVDPAENRANFAIVVAHAGARDDRDLPHVIVDAIHVLEPADFADGRIDQVKGFQLIQRLIAAFAPVVVTFDQYQSALSIEMLRAWCDTQSLPRRPQIFEETATAPHNYRVASMFKSAAQLGLVHAPRHDLARLELLHLQEHDGKVDPPSFGPIRTADIADALFEVTTRLVGQDLDKWHQLDNLPLGMSQAGGLPLAGTSAPTAESLHWPGPSGGTGMVRGRSGRGMPARGRHWR